MTGGSGAARVFFPCTGLGHQLRGFETFTRECAAALREDPRVQITVFGGGGPFAIADEHAVPNFPRGGVIARALGSLARREPYFIEQASFFAGFLPQLAAGRPDVVYFADLNLGNACWHWRRLTGQRFKLLFYNGGATRQPFTRCDLVQQVSPEHFAAALARGESAGRQVVLPHAIGVERLFIPPTNEERAKIRASFGVPSDRVLVLSVGMLDSSMKRMDYVIRELASLRMPRPYLVLAGAASPQTGAVIALARELLGDEGFTARAFPLERMPELYRAADVFVLASLHEPFGLAILEALRAGLPSVIHDTPTAAYVAGTHAARADLSVRGALAPLIVAAAERRENDSAAGARHAWVRDHFSWDVLAGRHAELLTACAAGRRPAWADETP